jgi:hypothetical protein
MTKRAEKAAVKAKRILTVARAAWFEAVDLCSCIVMLEASNEPDVIASINNAKAADALVLIRKALLGRLVMGVTGALAPYRDPGDFHLRVGMDLVREEVPRQTILLRGSALKIADIETAEHRWAESLGYEARGRLVIYRNKVVAHLSERPAMNDPIISELFTLARMIAAVAEALAHGTGIAGVSLESQVSVFRNRALAFWGKWKLGNTS